MQTLVRQYSQRFGAAALAVAALIAAATAQANPGKNLSAAPPLDSPRQCTDVDAILARLQFPAGTTFLVTDAGLVVLNQPKAVVDSQPEWVNTGN